MKKNLHLENTLMKLADLGYGLSFVQIQKIFRDYLVQAKTLNQFTKENSKRSWWKLFKKSNPPICIYYIISIFIQTRITFFTIIDTDKIKIYLKSLDLENSKNIFSSITRGI